MTTSRQNLFKVGLLALLGLTVAGCISFGGVSTPTPLPTIGPYLSPSPQASASSTSPGPDMTIDPALTRGFYLRVWQTQALPPQYTFGWLPSVTIANGQFIDGLVALPLVYPGPIYTGLSQQAISETGIIAIISAAQVAGLLGTRQDFTETPMPGSVMVHLTMTIDGTTYDLSGPLPGAPQSRFGITPGTTAAFDYFYDQLQTLSAWLRADLGPSTPYNPTAVAFMLTSPEPAAAPLVPAEVKWPLAGNFANFGAPTGLAADRCAILSGQDLATLLPAAQNANALTRFVDASGAKMSLITRILLPGEDPQTVC